MEVKNIIETKIDDGRVGILAQTDLSATNQEQVGMKHENIPPDVLERIFKILDVFTTDSESAVYAFKHLTPEFVAGLFAKYSRSPENMIDVFVDHVMEMGMSDEELDKMIEGARLLEKFNDCAATKKLHERFTKGGHDSIKKMADGIPVAVDVLSMLAASKICSGRIGMSVTERSSRYQKDFFKPRFVNNFMDADDTSTKMRYDLLMRTAYATAKAVYDDVMSYLTSKYPYKPDHPMIEQYGITEATWKKWIKNRALDNARYCLPVSSITGLGIVGNVPAYGRIVSKLANSKRDEEHLLGGLIAKAVKAVCPTIGSDAEYNYHDEKYGSFDDKDINSMRSMIMDSVADESKVLLGPPTSDVDLCRLAMDRKHMNESDLFTLLAAIMIGRQVSLPPDVVYHWINSDWFKNIHGNFENPAPGFSDSIKFPINSYVDFAIRVLGKYTGKYVDGQIVDYRHDHIRQAEFSTKNIGEVSHHEKLPRVFEMIDLTFDMVLDFGAWRDLQRHGMMSQVEWALIPNLGYAVPDDFDLLTETTKDLYQTLFAMSVEMWELLRKRYGQSTAEYAGLMMWNQRRWLKMNLREADYIIGLRSRYTGHHSYRRASQLMFKRIVSLWPTMKHFLRPNMNDYIFGLVRRTESDHKNSNNNLPEQKIGYVPVADRKENEEEIDCRDYPN